MAGIFKYVVHGALGGKSAKEQFSVTFDVQQNSALNSQETRDNANAIVGALQHAFVEDVYFLRVHVKQQADNPLNQPSKDFLSVGQTVQGARVPPANAAPGFADVLPKDFSVQLSRDADVNRSGRVLLPYCLMMGDVEQTREGGFTLKLNSDALGPINTTLAALRQPLPEGTFVIPDKVDTLSELFVQRGRPVILWSFAGVTDIRRTRRRVSVKSAVRAAEKRRLKEIVRSAKDLLGDNFAGQATGAALGVLNTLKGEVTAAIGAMEAGEGAAILSELPAVLVAL
jgi:hypothetical protein